jgi:hydrophobic/amphiphilic exporter-1 (mainly G- bacteria), HAE1 family
MSAPAPRPPATPRPTAEGRWEGLLPRFSLHRRITVLVLLASSLVVGTVATLGIPLEMFPRGYTAPFLAVEVPWRDAPATEAMEKIVVPLEEELSTVRGLDHLNSYARTGYARCSLVFKHGTDMKVAYREVRDRVERARSRMPEDADRVFIRKHDTSAFPVAFVGIIVDPAVTDPYDLIQNEVILRLERLEGVASARANGLEQKEVLIELDRQRTEASGLNIYQLAQQLGGDNFSLASGNVRSGSKKLLLRSIARYASVEELRRRLVAPAVRLGDIATIKYEEPEKKYRIRVNSRPAVGVEVLKEGEANTLEVSRAIRAEVERMKDNPRLAGLGMEVLFDQGKVILESLGTLFNSGKVGVLLAVAVLFFFLRRFRMTLIIALSIPLSMVIALAVMYFAGETLNVLSLLGLMICVGLLVDNSVVVAENVFRLHRDGLPRREAAIRGAGEIALAITMATLTTVAVFLPVSLVEGQAQFFLLRMAIPISVSLLASLFVALVFVPLSVYLTLPERANGNGNGGNPLVSRVHRLVDGALRRAYYATFERLNDAYGKLLGVFLRRGRWLDLSLLLLLLFAASIAVVKSERVKITPDDEDEAGGFEIDVEMPQSQTFPETEQYFLSIEKVLASLKDELGLEGYFFWHGTTGGEIQGWFTSPRTSKLSPTQVTARVLAALPEKPGVKFYTGQESETDQEDKDLFTLTLNGEDAGQLDRVAGDLEGVFAKVDGVLSVKRSGDRSLNELALVIDRDRTSRQGINPAVVAGVVGYALRGQALPRFWAEGREIPVRVRFEERDRESLAQLADFDVPTEGGELVPLSAVTDVRFLPGAQRIQRLDKQLARTITLELVKGQEEETRKRLTALSGRIDLPEGVRFGNGPERAGGLDEDMRSMLFAAALSVVFIYLLMAFLFESFILPLSILLTIPLAFIGVVGVHLAVGKNIDFLGMVGLVLLIGVVVNNGIVLIDYVNRLRKEGWERSEAILAAAHRRFRPIMMTALTTICGMFPLTVGGASSIGLSYKSFGYTLIGGMSTATFLTLLVVPVAYTVFDDVREHLTRAVQRVLAGRRATPQQT